MSDGEAGGAEGVGSLVAAYRHDAHKLRGRSHADADGVVAGVRVNEEVPRGADRDAALLSRPVDDPEKTVANHVSPFRLSLVSGEQVASGFTGEVVSAAKELLQVEGAVASHEAWLSSDVAAVFNESPYFPYTSVKFHTLLVAALLDNYRAGFEFDELFLAVSSPGSAGEVVPHRTVLLTSGFALHVTGAPEGRPAARLGERPARSFADVWSRLPALPFETSAGRRWRVLDAQLRRVRSWSAALQLIEEFCDRFDPGSESGRASGGGR